jgi:flavin-binding protein dodecin
MPLKMPSRVRRKPRAAETLKGIKSIYVQNFEVAVSKDQITKYRINAKIPFLLEKKSK